MVYSKLRNHQVGVERRLALESDRWGFEAGLYAYLLITLRKSLQFSGMVSVICKSDIPATTLKLLSGSNNSREVPSTLPRSNRPYQVSLPTPPRSTVSTEDSEDPKFICPAHLYKGGEEV